MMDLVDSIPNITLEYGPVCFEVSLLKLSLLFQPTEKFTKVLMGTLLYYP